jgi:hypothetical protein
MKNLVLQLAEKLASGILITKLKIVPFAKKIQL